MSDDKEDHAAQTRREAASDVVEGPIRHRASHGTPPAKPMTQAEIEQKPEPAADPRIDFPNRPKK